MTRFSGDNIISLNTITTTGNELNGLAREVLADQNLIAAMLNAPRLRLPHSLTQVQIKPVLLKGERKYQFAYHQARKVTHRNLTEGEAQAEIVTLLTTQFRQGVFYTTQGEAHALLNKRQEVTIRRTQQKTEEGTGRRGDKEKRAEIKRGEASGAGSSAGMISANASAARDNLGAAMNKEGAAGDNAGAASSAPTALMDLRHDRPKNHLLPEGQSLPFLVGLGVMTADGRVIAAKRDKFRQINRFLEMTADVVSALKKRAHQNPERPLRIVDFGCGKAYLTFALYHYLHNLRGLNIALVGVDLKQDVLAQCSALAVNLGYAGLSFAAGGIQNFALDGEETADMVIALHACDTATDDALARAVAWNAQVILAAPCCQHELFRKIQNDALAPLLRHGILRERLSALVTDALRAEMLAAHGYAVQMLEFVEAEHTPKNILIRAVKRGDSTRSATQAYSQNAAAQESYARFRDFWHVQPYIEHALTAAMSKIPPDKTGHE